MIFDAFKVLCTCFKIYFKIFRFLYYIYIYNLICTFLIKSNIQIVIVLPDQAASIMNSRAKAKRCRSPADKVAVQSRTSCKPHFLNSGPIMARLGSKAGCEFLGHSIWRLKNKQEKNRKETSRLFQHGSQLQSLRMKNAITSDNTMRSSSFNARVACTCRPHLSSMFRCDIVEKCWEHVQIEMHATDFLLTMICTGSFQRCWSCQCLQDRWRPDQASFQLVPIPTWYQSTSERRLIKACQKNKSSYVALKIDVFGALILLNWYLGLWYSMV